LSSKG